MIPHCSPVYLAKFLVFYLLQHFYGAFLPCQLWWTSAHTAHVHTFCSRSLLTVFALLDGKERIYLHITLFILNDFFNIVYISLFIYKCQDIILQIIMGTSNCRRFHSDPINIFSRCLMFKSKKKKNKKKLLNKMRRLQQYISVNSFISKYFSFRLQTLTNQVTTMCVLPAKRFIAFRVFFSALSTTNNTKQC